MNFSCWLGRHTYEVYKEEELHSVNGTIVGKVIISRCTECGKLKVERIHTIENY